MWLLYNRIEMLRFVVVFALFAVAARAANCNLAQNVISDGSYSQFSPVAFWNPACTNPLDPYCTGTFNGTRCNYCDPSRIAQYWSICDCPAGQYCQPNAGEPTYGTCIPFDLSGAQCLANTDCPIYGYSGIIGYWSCVNQKCSMCNQTFYGNETLTCPGGSPYPLSSRQGETRTCNAAGSWIGGGAIVVPSPTAKPASPSTSGATTKGPRTSLLFTAAVAAVVTLGRLGL